MDEAYTVLAKDYDKYHGRSTLPLMIIAKKACMKVISPRPGAKFLDMAAGTGDATEYFFEYQDGVNHDTDSTATLVDLNTDMLAIAKRRLGDTKWAKDGRIEFLEGNAEHIPEILQNTFDIYCCYLGMHNMPSRDKVLKEAMRMLKPGGKIYIIEANTGTWRIGRVARRLVLQFLEYCLMGNVENQTMRLRVSRSGLKFPSPPDFVQEMKDAGFIVENCGYQGVLLTLGVVLIGTKPTE